MASSTPLSTASGIYAIYSACNERRYIGSAVNIKQRWKGHRTHLRWGDHKNPHLQNAWNKYGEDAFEFYVIEECAVEQLIEREQYYMDQCPDKYNINPIAGSSLGVKRSPETKDRIRAARIGSKASDEARANMSEAGKGRVPSLETRKKISDANMGHEVSEETRESVRQANRTRVVSDETRARMSKAKIGNQNAAGAAKNCLTP